MQRDFFSKPLEGLPSSCGASATCSSWSAAVRALIADIDYVESVSARSSSSCTAGLVRDLAGEG